MEKLNRKNLLSALMLGLSILFLGIFPYCQGEKNIKPSIQGEWRDLFDECIMERDANIIKICNEFVEARFLFSTSRSSYILSESAESDGGFQIKQFDFNRSVNGKDFEHVAGDRDTIVDNLYYLHNDILIWLYYKGGGVSHEYMVAEAYIRNDEDQKNEYTQTISTVFVLPDGFRGYGWVAMEQPYGEPIQYDSKGRPLFEIPENGKLETKAEVSPVAIALRELGFYFREDWNNGQSTIPTIGLRCLMLFEIERYTDEEIINNGYDPDRVYAHYSRYNPGRELVNKAFNKEIKGQVFTFRVDTLRNLLKSAPMVD